MDEHMFFLLIAIGLAYAVGCWGKTRKIGFGLAFLLSILNLIIGIIAVALSEKVTTTDNRSNKSYIPWEN